MPEELLTVSKQTCLRCGHGWFPNKAEQPRVCPACHSPYWNTPRKTDMAKAIGALDKRQIIKKLESNSAKIYGYGVKDIGVFGSFARGTERQGSDIDILVTFRKDKLDLHSYMGLKSFLEDLFQRKVDLVIRDDIKPALRSSILRDVVYA